MPLPPDTVETEGAGASIKIILQRDACAGDRMNRPMHVHVLLKFCLGAEFMTCA